MKSPMGTITSDPGGIFRGDSCVGDFVQGGYVILRATPNPGWILDKSAWQHHLDGNNLSLPGCRQF